MITDWWSVRVCLMIFISGGGGGGIIIWLIVIAWRIIGYILIVWILWIVVDMKIATVIVIMCRNIVLFYIGWAIKVDRLQILLIMMITVHHVWNYCRRCWNSWTRSRGLIHRWWGGHLEWWSYLLQLTPQRWSRWKGSYYYLTYTTILGAIQLAIQTHTHTHADINVQSILFRPMRMVPQWSFGGRARFGLRASAETYNSGGSILSRLLLTSFRLQLFTKMWRNTK